MKLSRDGITYIGPVQAPSETAIDDLQEFFAPGGSAGPVTGRAGLSATRSAAKLGNAVLGSLQPRFRCLGCGNKEGNRWIIGQLLR